MDKRDLQPHELDSIYNDSDERFVVSFIVSYADDDLDDWFERLDGENLTAEDKAKLAVGAALDLTRDAGSPGTVWFAYDRREGQMYRFEQGDIEGKVIR